MATARARKARFPPNLADAAQKAHEALVEMVAEGNDALHGRVLRQGHAAGRSTSSTACAQAVREMRIFPVLCASGLHNIGTDLILEFHRRISARAHRARADAAAGNGKEARRRSPNPALLRCSSSRPRADPFAGRITYFKVIPASSRTMRTCRTSTRSAGERLAHIGIPHRQDASARHRTARRRYRRGREAEGDADRRHPGGQGLHRQPIRR